MLVPLAGGGQETLLSEVGFVLLPFFTTAEACALRLVCREFLAAVTEHPWENRHTVMKGRIAAWRACFPHARCANVQGFEYSGGLNRRAAPVVDAEFVHFEGLRELYMAGCQGVTDAAFVHLRSIHTLVMAMCYQDTITDAAFAHLVGIQRLSLWGCSQATITDAAFAHLRGIELLNMSECRQFTDAAFVHLRGIHKLYMWSCYQPAITDAACGAFTRWQWRPATRPPSPAPPSRTSVAFTSWACTTAGLTRWLQRAAWALPSRRAGACTTQAPC